MSRLADPAFEDIYCLSKDIKESCLELVDQSLETDLEPLVNHVRVLQKLVGKIKINIDHHEFTLYIKMVDDVPNMGLHKYLEFILHIFIHV